jgi:cytochrome P450
MAQLLLLDDWLPAHLDLAVSRNLWCIIWSQTFSHRSLILRIGDAVRFKPDGVLFNSPTAYRAIYQAKANVKKGKLYETWPRNAKNVHTLATVDKMVHARKRRVLNSAFSEKAIRSAELFIVKHVDRWNEILLEGNNGKEWSKPQNISDLADYLVFDIMGDLSFGKSFELKEPGENSLRHMPHTIAESLQFLHPVGSYPNHHLLC